MTSDDAFIPNASATTAEKKRRFDTIDFTTTTTTNTASSSSSHLFKRGGAKATKYSELLEREKPDAKLPTREELRVKTTEQSKEQFDLLVSAWSRERKASTNNIAVAIWDEKLKLAKVVKQKGKSLSKFGYSAAAANGATKETGANAATVTTTTIASSADNGGGAVYLFPEEVAFLVETERVCLFWQARGKGLEPASVKSIHEMLEECGVSMETYVTYAQLCRIGYVARRFGAPWVVPERVKANARKKRENETYVHRIMAGEGEWVFKGVDNNNNNNNNNDGNDENRRREEQEKRLHLLSQGAEARVFSTTFLGKPCVVKQRFRKKYRHPVLDQKLTRSRLFAECRSLMKARILGVQAPTVLFVDKRSSSIFMERVEGKSLKEVLKSIAAEEDEEGEEKKEEEKTTPPRNATAEDATAAPSSSSPLSSSAHRRAVKYGREIGLIVSKLHDGNITHGDLTTSNFLVHAQTDSIYVIDFGLSKTQIVGEEDIGVDLYVLERSLVSAHSREGARVWQECLRTWKETCGKSKEAFKRYEEVRARGRKRSMVG